ncbi:MAG: glycosyltransferase, partial [Terriglobales bacterium]
TGGPGGAETVLLNLALRLDPMRFRSLALVSRDGWLQQRLENAGICTHVAKGKAWYDLRLPRTIARLVRQEKVDLIHSHLPGQNFYSALAGRLCGCPTIATYHGEMELADAGQLRGAFKLWFVRRSAAAVTVVADAMYRRLQDLGFSSSKLLHIYNGIDVARYQRAETGVLRKELGLSEGIRLVGTVANLRKSKGYEFLIRAAQRVVGRDPNVHFVAAGDFPPDLGQPLKQLLRDLGLEGCFHVLGFREDIPEILRDLDVFVLPSISEGLPLVILEAMGAGKPVVATRAGGLEEVLEDGATGVLVPPADAEALAGGICRVLNDPTLCVRLGEKARAHIEARYSVSQMIQQYEGLYDRCLSSDGNQGE